MVKFVKGLEGKQRMSTPPPSPRRSLQICRMALDTETMEGQPDRDTFLGIFYDHYVHWLVEPFWLGDLSAEGTRVQRYPQP